jgi:uncharacterized membrane protein YbhN (UPF0104 family)
MIGLRVVRYTAGVCLAGWLLTLVIPMVAGVPWATIASTVAGVPVAALATLVALWAFGLFTHTFTLTAALPRLTHVRALMLSLTGSAVANVLPLGGAAGIALNYQMVRRWGFDKTAFATYTVVTNAWDVLIKLALPMIALPWLALSDQSAFGGLVGTAAGATAVLAVVVGLAVAVLASARTAARVGAVAERVLDQATRILRRRPPWDIRRQLVDLQIGSSRVVRTSWRQLTLGMVAYCGTLLLLLWACLYVTGLDLPLVVVFTGFSVERLLTLLGLTPGGAGVVEVGLVGALLPFTPDAAALVSGVLLYRTLTFGLEIPTGAIGIAGWFWMLRHRTQLSGAGVV